MKNLAVFFLACIWILSSCRSATRLPQKLISAEKDQLFTFQNPDKKIDVMHLLRNENCSVHKVKLVGSEDPHIHKAHDLVVFVLSGKCKIHFKSRTVLLAPGDVISIPRNEIHWAENIDKDHSEAFIVFSPPFDGKDHIPVQPK